MKESINFGLLRKLLPVASVERMDEIYDRGSAIEVVVPAIAATSARALDEHSLLVGAGGVEHVIELPAAVERGSLAVETYGDLALLRFQKLPEIAASEPASHALPGSAAGALR